ncbi:hypothetical protein CEQ90_00230 [Lewinellaceae bacterium SD302]|nr:hypothetical protein CEQ90_00230 [Lewinellaceae bacterium SD302]
MWKQTFYYNCRIRPLLTILLIVIFSGLKAQFGCSLFGGEFTLADGENSVFVCTDDGMNDNIVTNINGNSNGEINYVVTTPFGLILSTQLTPVFNFEGTGDGPVFIYNVVTDPTFTGSIDVGDNVCDLTADDGCFSLSTYITVIRLTGEDCAGLNCDVEGGDLSLAGGGGSITICAGDGQPDSIEVSLDNAEGSNMAWLITDTEGTILGLPAAPPFDLEGAGGGVCLIWNISFEDGLTGLEIGLDADDLEGCFSLSSPIQVIRNQVDGGTLAFPGGSDSISVCLDEGGADSIFVEQIDSSALSGANFTFVITDLDGNILGLPTEPPFNLSEAGAGTCLIWNLAFEDGLEGAAVGNNASDLEGCFDLSNPLSVVREICNPCLADAGMITFADGSDSIIVCLDPDSNSVVQALQVGAPAGDSTQYIITSQDGFILGAGNQDGVFDLADAGIDNCVIYFLSADEDIQGDTVGGRIIDLTGCFDLSNGIVTTRILCEFPDCEANAGNITFADGSTEIFVCLDPDSNTIVQAFVSNGGSVMGDNFEFIITSADGTILAVDNETGMFDVGDAGEGNCVIYFLASEGEIQGDTVGGPIAGINGCFDLSNGIVTVREICNPCLADGGMITFADGSDSIIVCLDPDSNSMVQAIQTGMPAGDNTQFIITNQDGFILGAGNQDGVFDLADAGIDECVIYFLSAEGEIQGDTVGGRLIDLTGCFDLSNGIITNRILCEFPDCEANAGNITFADGSTETLVCLDPDSNTIVQAFVSNGGSVMGDNLEFIITDAEGNILAVDNETGMFDVGDAGEGNCVIYFLASEGEIQGDTVGGPIDSINGCFDLSNGIVTVREFCEEPFCPANAGMITHLDGSTELEICLDSDSTTVTVIQVQPDSVSGTTFNYVISDENLDILAVQSGNVIDFGNVGPGICFIWYMAFQDSLPLIPGQNVGNLEGCIDVSNNITVIRTEDCDDGFTGNIVISELTANGELELLNTGSETINLASLYLTTGQQQFRLNELNLSCGELQLAPGDIMVIEQIPSLDIPGGELALFSAASFSAFNMVDYLRWGNAASSYYEMAVDANCWEVNVSLDPPNPENSLQLIDQNGLMDWRTMAPTPCLPNESPSSAQDPFANTKLTLFPNPVNEQLNIFVAGASLGKVTISILDQNGRRVRAFDSELGEQLVSIPTALLARGVYSLQISSNTGVISRRFVKI